MLLNRIKCVIVLNLYIFNKNHLQKKVSTYNGLLFYKNNSFKKPDIELSLLKIPPKVNSLSFYQLKYDYGRRVPFVQDLQRPLRPTNVQLALHLEHLKLL